MKRERKRMGDMLLAEGVVTEEQLNVAFEEGKKKGTKLGETLTEMGLVTEADIANVLASQLGIERLDLTTTPIEQECVDIITKHGDLLRKYSMVPVYHDKSNINICWVAMSDPMNMRAMDDFSIITNLQLEPLISTKGEIDSVLDKYYADAETSNALERFKQQRRDMFGDEEEQKSSSSDAVDNSPVVQIVRSMLEQAARQGASDIHIEALEREVRVRFRIDGVLHKRFSYDASMLPAIIARLKIIGGMDISEKRKPQDGRISMRVDHVEYDVRVSILPTMYGEKCVMRLAAKKGTLREISKLGMTPENEARFMKLLQNTHGILLVTGPTGSGKSTTLYTVLDKLNNEEVNIITVEDPIESNINGINQVQVNPKADMTFASALRSILRQDPDIIMIGEIRDGETAQIAVRASITGHLVVSTLHTNSAATAMARLQDMGVESYLLADSVFGVVAQRLMRRLCEWCKKEKIATPEELQMMGLPRDSQPRKIYEPCGCEKCGQTGYAGRIGIYEILTVTPAIKELVHDNATGDRIEKVAKQEGMTTLGQNAAIQVLNGVTSIAEMIRTTSGNE